MSNQNRFKLDDETQEGLEMGPSGEGSPSGASFEGMEDNPDSSPEAFERDKGKLIDFLQYPREKRKITEFLEETYKQYEEESVDRTINRVIHEHESELQGATPYYRPGHIGPLLYEYLNMVGVENAFVSGLQHTKSSMTKTVQQRVDEINTLLRGIGGFNRQLKASFSRSAVVYLEQEDPQNTYREKIIFSINLGDFELRYPLEESYSHELTEDGRTVRRVCWDEAVNTLAEIVSNTGLKPKYVKNDKNSCVFTMRQILLSKYDTEPDEFFVFDLRHVNQAQMDVFKAEYIGAIEDYNNRIAKLQSKLRIPVRTRKQRALIEKEIATLLKQRDFYVGTHPDPREMDTGLLFQISANTLKDYSITKDKMQVIMTKYILALSRIAVDKSMDQQVNTVYQQKQSKPTNFQELDLESRVNKKKRFSFGGRR